MKNITKSLSLIYKANQCADKSDVRTAIAGVIELQKVYGHNPALTRRMLSLNKRMEVVPE